MARHKGRSVALNRSGDVPQHGSQRFTTLLLDDLQRWLKGIFAVGKDILTPEELAAQGARLLGLRKNPWTLCAIRLDFRHHLANHSGSPSGKTGTSAPARGWHGSETGSKQASRAPPSIRKH